MKVGNWISACLPIGNSPKADKADKADKAAGKSKAPSRRESRGVLGKLTSWSSTNRSKKEKGAKATGGTQPSTSAVHPDDFKDALEYLNSGGKHWSVPTAGSNAQGKPTLGMIKANPSWNKGRLSDLLTHRGTRDEALNSAARAVRTIPHISAEEIAAGAGRGGIASGPAFIPRPAVRADAGNEDTVPPLVAEYHDINPAAVRAWLAQRGVETVPNSGKGMNCLLISLLQHATGRYDAASEPELAEEAEKCRVFLREQHPEIEELDRTLHADEPAIKSALAYINTRCRSELEAHWVEPHADGHAVRWLSTNDGHQDYREQEPVAIIRFGNHFEALRAVGEEVPLHTEGGKDGIHLKRQASDSSVIVEDWDDDWDGNWDDDREPVRPVYNDFAKRLGIRHGSSGDFSLGDDLKQHLYKQDSFESSGGSDFVIGAYRRDDFDKQDDFDGSGGFRFKDGDYEQENFGKQDDFESSGGFEFEFGAHNREASGGSGAGAEGIRHLQSSDGLGDYVLHPGGLDTTAAGADALDDDLPAGPRSGLGVLDKVTQALKDGVSLITDPDKRHLHGIGITSTTKSTPIRSDTWTPQPKPYTGFRYDNEAAIALQFGDDVLPPGSERPALREKLVQVARDTGLTENETVRLTQSFRAAFEMSADPAREALAALNTLLDTSFVDSIRTVGFRIQPRAAGADRAWTLAQHIVAPASGGRGKGALHDDVGARLIGKLALPSLASRPSGASREVVEHDQAMLGELTAVFLRASRQALTEAGGAQASGCDAASVLGLGRLGEATKGRSPARNWPGRNGTPVPRDLTHAQRALLAVKNQLTAWSDHIGRPENAQTPFTLDQAATQAMKRFATTVETPEPARVAVTAPPVEPAMTHPVLEKPSTAAPREAPPELEIVSRLNADDALKTMFDEKPELLRGTQRSALFEAINGLRRTKANTEGLTPEQAKAEEQKQANKLTGPESVMLTHALDLAFGNDIDPSERSLTALQALSRTNLLDSLRQIGTPKAPSAAAEGADELWRLAQEIVQIPGGVGKSLIAKLTPGPAQPRDPRTHASVADKERLVLNVFFKAAQRIREEATTSSSGKGRITPGWKNDPASIYDFGRLGDVTRGRTQQDWPGRDGAPVPANLTIAEKALLAVRDELRALDEHAQDPQRLATPFTKGTHGCRFAIPMIRNGLVTDAARDLDGKPSQFRMIESRVAKGMGKHVDRAIRNPTGWSNFKSKLRRIASPFTRKSPFLTHNRVAEETPGRGIGVVNQGGTHAARAQGDMMVAVAAALDAHVHSQPDWKEHVLTGNESGNAALRLLVRAEVARQVKGQAFFMTRHSTPKRLINFGKDKAIATVLDKLAPPADAEPTEREANAALRAGLRERIAALVEQENQEILTPHTLLNWAADIGGPDSPVAAQRLASNEAADSPWNAFSKDFLLLTKGSVAPISMESFKGKERKDVADALASVVAAEELGSAFSFDNAGNLTVTTKGVQDTVTSVATGFVAKVHIDLGGGLVRTVRFESSNSTDRTQLRVAVQTLKKVETGVGGALGTGPVPLKGAVDVGYTYDVVHQEGAVLGFPRNLTGGSPGDRAASARKAELVKLLINHASVGGAGGDYARPGNEEDRRSLIKSALHAFGDDLSIGYFEQSRSDHTGSGSVGAVLGLEGLTGGIFGQSVAGVVGGNVGGRYLKATMQYRDRSGFLRTERDTAQTMWRGSLQGTGAAVLGHEAIDPDPHAAVPDAASNVLSAPAPLYSISSDIWRKGVQYQSTAIVQDGEEHPTSYATHTYQSPIDFLRGVREKLPEMAEGKSKKFFGAEYNNEDPAVREERVALEAAYVKEFSAWAVSQRDATATPQIYYEFDSTVATSNQLRAYEYVMARSGNLAQAQSARKDIDTIHADGRYREAHFVTYPQSQQEGRTAGINGILGVTYAGTDNRAQQVLTFS